jgi:hypothetical protein
MKFWPGTAIPISTGNSFDVRIGEPSIFRSDPRFCNLKNGKTRGETATETVADFRAENGRCRGTIVGISKRGDCVMENRWASPALKPGRVA